MGYKRKKTFRLTWADGEFEGLEVRVRSMSVERFLEFGPLLEADLSSTGPDGLAELRELFEQFATVLVDWNLEDEDTDEPVPCTAAGFMGQDIKFVNEIITKWAEHIAGVAAPLDERSSSGEPSLEASLPMAPLSESLAS